MNVDLIISTPDRQTALEYLQKALPSLDLDEEKAKPILDLVEAGKVRVGDPEVCGGSADIYVIDEGCRGLVEEWYRKLIT